ncbi:C40 family peptidase [Geothermobacter hydrogeniphilus]|nr:NlpC/P60 family protein [Geothermobacter hydrogeniphilus]
MSLVLLPGLLSCAGQPRTAAPAPPPAGQVDPIAALLPRTTPAPMTPGTDPRPAPTATAKPSRHHLERMGFSTQVGAFSNLDNAVRLERALDAKGIDAYYFRHESGLYKVRFGNHKSYRAARKEAETLRRLGLIGRFFIVIPEDYAAARIRRSGKGNLRNELVRTARRFLGVPYRWGGEDRKRGFDCSGLTMVCYRLNGLNLPRNSRMQYRAGRAVGRRQLHKGDLVFFATHGGKRVTHVGIYAGGDKFIHAPRTGKTVRYASLSNAYWRKAYVGARSYL